MTDQLISKENLSKNLIKQIFEDAYYDVIVEDDGQLKIKDQYSYYVDVDKKGRFIAFWCNILLNEKSPLSKRYEFVNDINYNLIAIRVSEHKKIFSFDHYLWVEGGVTKKNIVLAFKNFISLVDTALARGVDEIFA
ncbi:MAG: YbjN domain-containing protein [Calditrichaeota bacterium]|nr:MAG: YbjN domain-containing protein [Calditrichota bacterium]